MEPYVPTAQAYVVEDDGPTETKKKKKKKKQTTTAATATAITTDAQTSSDPYVPVEATTSKKPKSSKSKKKPKSKKSKKKSTTITSSTSATAHPVLEASGWEPLLISKVNEEHAKKDSTSSTSTGHRYAITGHESQIVTIEIPPGESCQGEPGSMMYLSDALDMSVTCGSDWFGRCCGGESCCVLNFENNSGGGDNNSGTNGFAGLVTNAPLAKVVPVDLTGEGIPGGTLIVQSGAYMASFGEVHIGFDCDCNLVRCCCGGMGLVRQKIHGTGTAFLGATGTIVQKVLGDKEVMLLDTNCLLAYAESCTFDLKATGGIVNWIGGGEGFFNSSITGPGLVVVQSMNMCMLMESLAATKMYRR